MAITKLSNSGIATGGVLKYDSMLAGNAAYIPTDFESIATISVGAGNAASIEFTSIPSDYVALQVRAIMRGDISYCLWTFNNDTTVGNYVSHYMQSNGSSAYSGADVNTLAGLGLWNPPTAAATNNYCVGNLDIFDYALTSKYKTVRSLNGFDLNGSGVVTFQTGVWKSTSAVTSLKIVTNGGAGYPFLQHSHFALYGIKGV